MKRCIHTYRLAATKRLEDINFQRELTTSTDMNDSVCWWLDMGGPAKTRPYLVLTKLRKIERNLIHFFWFPGGLVASMWCAHRQGLGSFPGQGTNPSHWRVACALSLRVPSLGNGQGCIRKGIWPETESICRRVILSGKPKTRAERGVKIIDFLKLLLSDQTHIWTSIKLTQKVRVSSGM